MSLVKNQLAALDFIKKDIMGEYMRTGVQFAINVTVFQVIEDEFYLSGG